MTRRMLIGWCAGLICSGCLLNDSAFPPDDQVLAQHSDGRWLNIDFMASEGSDVLEQAQRCVRSHPDEAAVACFAFGSPADYDAAMAISAGNFAGALCWSARWQRNSLGTESGMVRPASPAECPGHVEAAAPSTELSERHEPAAALEVRIDFDVERDSRSRARIYGTTNLPDGTVLAFSMQAVSDRALRQSHGDVNNGRFTSEWFGSPGGRGLPSGAYEVGVTVPFFNAQPASVRSILGAQLQHMTGALVEWMNPSEHSLGKVASIERVVTM